VFVKRAAELPRALLPFAYPTLAGRQLPGVPGVLPEPTDVILAPYDGEGCLLPIGRLGALGRYLENRDTRARLMQRTCVTRKPWYAFHETPPLRDALRPKLICKDIAREPIFWVDSGGAILPRHTVYYVVPKEKADLGRIHEYLATRDARTWLAENCQRAANGFLRLQSNVLGRLPIPSELAPHRCKPKSAEVVV